MILATVVLYIALFIGFGALLFPYATAETLIIRGAGSAAFLLLHVVLCIGRFAVWIRDFFPCRTLGLLQSETRLVLALATGAGLAAVLSLHLAAGLRERTVDRKNLNPAGKGFVDACSVEVHPDAKKWRTADSKSSALF